MNPESCIVCGNTAQFHIDERRNRHVTCPTCGGYIAAEGFGEHFLKLDSAVQQNFGTWMLTTRDRSNRYLHKAKPLKNNPYSKDEGFELISISRIKTGTFRS